MGKIICQYGVEHGRCRCTSDHVKTVVCNVPEKHQGQATTAGNGHWISQKSKEHVCEKPAWNRDVRRGDIWECSCGRQWAVLSFESGTSWNPSPTTILWRAHHDEIKD